MEIKRVGENKIRCALTEEEIRDMGFDIDEIIGNGEATQKFMRVVLKIVEEHENISLENISPMVKAELLSDHSMAITFGGDSDTSFQQLMEAISDLVRSDDAGEDAGVPKLKQRGAPGSTGCVLRPEERYKRTGIYAGKRKSKEVIKRRKKIKKTADDQQTDGLCTPVL